MQPLCTLPSPQRRAQWDTEAVTSRGSHTVSPLRDPCSRPALATWALSGVPSCLPVSPKGLLTWRDGGAITPIDTMPTPSWSNARHGYTAPFLPWVRTSESHKAASSPVGRTVTHSKRLTLQSA